MQNILGASWKTTGTGLLSIFAAIGAGAVLIQHSNLNLTSPEWLAAIAAFTNGIGNLCSRDNKVTSEQAGANK